MDQLATEMDKFSRKTEGREMVIPRLLAAPQKLVFKVWTAAARLINWWEYNGFNNTFHEIDIKPVNRLEQKLKHI